MPKTWQNPSGEFHTGIVYAYELFPKPLKERVIKERREKCWNPQHRACAAAVQIALNNLDGSETDNNKVHYLSF